MDIMFCLDESRWVSGMRPLVWFCMVKDNFSSPLESCDINGSANPMAPKIYLLLQKCLNKNSKNTDLFKWHIFIFPLSPNLHLCISQEPMLKSFIFLSLFVTNDHVIQLDQTWDKHQISTLKNLSPPSKRVF